MQKGGGLRTHVGGPAEGDDVAVLEGARALRDEVAVQVRAVEGVLIRDAVHARRVDLDLRVLARQQARHARAVQLHYVAAV